MLISEFDFSLPEELIAQNPLEKREASKMLVVNRGEKNLRDEHFYQLPQFLKKGDVMALGIDGLGEQRQLVVPFKK